MSKSKICTYWENKNCKFMDESFKCQFAHGDNELNKIICKYGSNCYNSVCTFNHGSTSTITNMVYDIPITYKIKKKKNNKNIKNKNNNSLSLENLDNNGIIPFNKYIPHIDENQKNITTVKIINKEKGIKEKINIFNRDYDKVLSIIDCFYIEKYNTMVYENNKTINNLNTIVNDKILLIDKIKKENEDLKKIIEKTKNKNTIIYTEENKKYRNNETVKLKSLYNKYINIYSIFNKYKNYELINFDEIKKYTNDKNIYKIKQRSTKIYKFYEMFKQGIIKQLLPVSIVFKMVF